VPPTTTTTTVPPTTTTTTVPPTTTTTTVPPTTTTTTVPPTTTTTTVPPTTTTTTTVPSANAVSFLAFGDFGVRNSNQQRVADRMTSYTTGKDLDAWVTTGDNVYSTGDPSLFQASLRDPYPALLGRVNMDGVLGNHDVDTSRAWAQQQLDFLQLPGFTYEKIVVDGPVSVQFLFLDSNGTTTISGQDTWLDTKLSEGNPTYRVVVFHHPPSNCGTGHSANSAVYSNWVPLMNGRADLVLSGHEHSYQRFSTPSGTPYVITGGGGQSTYALNAACTSSNGATLVKAQAVRHFMYVSATTSAMRVNVVDENGGLIETFTL